MAFYENTIIAKQDLATNELKTIKDKYESQSISKKDLQKLQNSQT